MAEQDLGLLSSVVVNCIFNFLKIGEAHFFNLSFAQAVEYSAVFLLRFLAKFSVESYTYSV